MLKITAKIKARPFPKTVKENQSVRFNDIKTVEIEGTDFDDVKSQLAELINALSQDIPVLQFAYDLDFRYGQLTPLVDAYYQMINKKAQEEMQKMQEEAKAEQEKQQQQGAPAQAQAQAQAQETVIPIEQNEEQSS